MPALRYQCPHCGQDGETNPDWAGKAATCPGCSKVFKLPEEVPQEEPQFEQLAKVKSQKVSQRRRKGKGLIWGLAIFNPEASRRERYPALYTVAIWYEWIAFLNFALASLGAFSAAAWWLYAIISAVADGQNATALGMLATGGMFFGVWIAYILVFVVLMIAMAESIFVFIDIEANTRRAAEKN